jgi:hypothetical protein
MKLKQNVALALGLLLLFACQRQPARRTQTDATTGTAATSTAPALPFAQQVQAVIYSKNLKAIMEFRKNNRLHLEKAGLAEAFDRIAADIAREQALAALHTMEHIAPTDVASARTAWRQWHDVDVHYCAVTGKRLLTEKEWARFTHAEDVILAHDLVTRAMQKEVPAEQASLYKLSPLLKDSRLSGLEGGWSRDTPRPNGIRAIRDLYDEGLLKRPELLQLLRIGVRDPSAPDGNSDEIFAWDNDRYERSLLALIHLDVPASVKVDGSGLGPEERLKTGLKGFKSLIQAFQLSEAELVDIGLTGQEARFVLRHAGAPKDVATR